MSAAGVLVIFLVIGVLPLLVLYLVVDQETSDPTVVKRSEAEQLARDRGGRPTAREPDRADGTDDENEWGSTDEWGDRRD